jgi:hypothetical protein
VRQWHRWEINIKWILMKQWNAVKWIHLI